MQVPARLLQKVVRSTKLTEPEYRLHVGMFTAMPGGLYQGKDDTILT